MKTVSFKLDNGLRVVLRESHAARVVAIQAWFGVGGADEAAGEAGLAHVLEHMLFKGTGSRGVGEIVRDIERAGGYVNAWTSHDETVFHVTVAGDRAERGLEVLADAVQNAALDADELERERAVILEEIRMGADNPSRAAMELLFARMFRRHPYGRPVIGSPETVGRCAARTLRRFYSRWYVPANAVLVAVGDFDSARMRAAVQRSFGGWRARPIPRRTSRVAEGAQAKLRQAYRVLPVFEAKVALGVPIPGLNHADVPALDLLAAVLGQGASSRLEDNVRRAAALASDIRAAAFTPADSGVFGVFAMTAPHSVPALVGAVTREIDRLTRDPVSPREIEKARTALLSDAVYSEETVDGVARKLGYYGLHASDGDFERRYTAALATADSADLLEIARRYLRPSAMTIAAVVPDPTVADYPAGTPWIGGRGAKRSVRFEALAARVRAAVERAAAAGPRRTVRRGAAAGAGTVVRTLPDGDTVIVKPSADAKIVAARVAFLGGIRHEPKTRAGLVTLLASSLTRGTTSRSALQVAAEMDALASSIAGFSGRNTFGIHGEFLARSFAEGFSLLAECMRAPSLPDEEVERERQLQIDDIRAGRDDLEQQVFELFQETLFGAHPYSRSILGKEETVRAITRDALREHLRRTTAAGRAVVAVVGGADPDEVVEMVRRGLGSDRPPMARAPEPKSWLPAKRPRQVGRSVDKEQSHLVLGFPGTTTAAADRHAIELLTEILGGHGGRLFAGVRETRGLAYAVSAASMEGIEPGYVALYAATAPGQEGEVVGAMLEEIRRLAARGPSRAELERVKRHLLGSRAIASQRASARAAAAALGWVYGLGPDSDEAYPAEVRAVRSADVVEAARRYLDPRSAVLAVVGPGGGDARLL
jgi:zinc protease